jgi:CRP-like cAMP-binding protein
MEKQLFNFISKYMTLTEEEKNAIIEVDIFKSYKKDTILLKEGAHSNKSYFVLQGIIRCYYIVDGEEKTTAFYTESEPFSPLCVIEKEPSTYYVSCLEDCILAVSTPDMEEEVFKKFPRFESLCRILSEELLAKSQLSFDEFKNSTPEQRYLHLSRTRPDLIQRVPQYQIASFLGIKPESLSRIRKRVMHSK